TPNRLTTPRMVAGDEAALIVTSPLRSSWLSVASILPPVIVTGPAMSRGLPVVTLPPRTFSGPISSKKLLRLNAPPALTVTVDVLAIWSLAKWRAVPPLLMVRSPGTAGVVDLFSSSVPAETVVRPVYELAETPDNRRMPGPALSSPPEPL